VANLLCSVFTGLIEHLGVVESVQPSAAGLRLLIRAPRWPHTPTVGESIAVDGCCLTLAADPTTQGGNFAFDVIPESLSKTTLGGLVAGARVHLEPSATLATLLGGHLVQGHVDAVGHVLRVETNGQWRVRIAPPRKLMAYFAPKGSVCVQGVSLTIADVSPTEGWFEIALIPTTLDKTTLGGLRLGNGVNIECDAIAKTVVHYLRHFGDNKKD